MIAAFLAGSISTVVMLEGLLAGVSALVLAELSPLLTGTCADAGEEAKQKANANAGASEAPEERTLVLNTGLDLSSVVLCCLNSLN